MAEGKTLHWEKSLSYGHNVHHKIGCTKYVCIHVLMWNWAWDLIMRNGNGNPDCERRFDKVLNGHSQLLFFSQKNSPPPRACNVCFEVFVTVCWFCRDYFRTAISTQYAASQLTAQLGHCITACRSCLPIVHALHWQCDQSVAYVCKSLAVSGRPDFRPMAKEHMKI